MINALLGSKFCKEGVVPTTATINMLRHENLDSKSQTLSKPKEMCGAHHGADGHAPIPIGLNPTIPHS